MCEEVFVAYKKYYGCICLEGLGKIIKISIKKML